MIIERLEGLSLLTAAEKAQLAEELWQEAGEDSAVPPEHLPLLEGREAKYGDSKEGVTLEEAMNLLRIPDSQLGS